MKTREVKLKRTLRGYLTGSGSQLEELLSSANIHNFKPYDLFHGIIKYKKKTYESSVLLLKNEKKESFACIVFDGLLYRLATCEIK